MKVLFVCEGNINRSQMAAAFLHQLRPDVEIMTAGTLVSDGMEGQLVAVESRKPIEIMKEVGIDISLAKVHQLTPQMVEDADRVVLMGPTPGGPLPDYLAASPKLEKWHVPDPGYNQIAHADARDMLKKLVDTFAQNLPLH